MKVEIKESEILFEEFSLQKYKDAIFIIDSTVDKIYEISNMLDKQRFMLINSGENTKSLNGFYRIIKFFIDKEISKDDEIVAIGGGTLLDLVGFATSVYKRGLNVSFIPTTLLSMADASIGGKNAVNFKNYKNLLGTFYMPKSISIDFNFLKSLPRKYLSSGYCEILKISMIDSYEFFNYLINEIDNKTLYNNLHFLVKKSIDFKINIIRNDLFDNNYRKILNFGHTIGHAIELSYHIPHGISVAYGIRYALELSIRYLGLNYSILEAYANHLSKFRIKFSKKFDVELIIKKLKYDKKSHSNFFKLILLEDIGKPIIYKIEYERFIADLKNLFKS